MVQVHTSGITGELRRTGQRGSEKMNKKKNVKRSAREYKVSYLLIAQWLERDSAVGKVLEPRVGAVASPPINPNVSTFLPQERTDVNGDLENSTFRSFSEHGSGIRLFRPRVRHTAAVIVNHSVL